MVAWYFKCRHMGQKKDDKKDESEIMHDERETNELDA